MNIDMIKHYKQCILSKQKLIQYYESKGNDGAVMVLEREIANMKSKGRKLMEEIKNGANRKI